MSATPASKAFARSGLSISEVSRALGINDAWAHDILDYEDEIQTTLSVSQALRLATLLQKPLPDLLEDPGTSPAAQCSFHDLANAVRSHCETQRQSLEAFEEQAGWDLRDFLAHPDSAPEQWSLDCLIDVCSAVGRNWREFLPA